MVVLAVTWMAKVGHEAEVAALFEKLTEQSRKEPGCAMYRCIGTKPNHAASSSTSNTRTMPRSKPTAPRRISCSTPAKIFPRSPTAWKDICSNRWARSQGGAGAPARAYRG